jgi:hypothetical protein
MDLDDLHIGAVISRTLEPARLTGCGGPYAS